jgi:hypothetical protein
MEVSGQLHASADLPPGKEPPVPIRYETGWAPDQVWTTWRRENSWPYRDSNTDPSAVQPVASLCTDWAIPDGSVHSTFLYSQSFLFVLRFLPFNFFVTLSNEQSTFASMVWAFYKRIRDVINFKEFHYISIMMWLCIYIKIKGVPSVATRVFVNVCHVKNASYRF